MESDIDRSEAPSPGAEFEVLGRLLLTLTRGADLRDVLNGLDYWPALGGYVIEWTDGPTATEVWAEILSSGLHSGIEYLSPEDFARRRDIPNDSPEIRLFLHVRGIRVELRSQNPVGLHEARQACWERLDLRAG